MNAYNISRMEVYKPKFIIKSYRHTRKAAIPNSYQTYHSLTSFLSMLFIRKKRAEMDRLSRISVMINWDKLRRYIWEEREGVAKIRICYNQSSRLSSDQPVILGHFLSSGPLPSLLTHHTLEERLELCHPRWLLAEDPIHLVVEGPELLELPLPDQSVQLVLRRGQLKRQFTHHQGEQQHSQRKYICLGGIVTSFGCMMTGMYFRSHIPLPSAFEVIESNGLSILLKMSSEPKVTKLDGELPVLERQQDILKLDISVSNAQGMQVPECGEQLFEESDFELICEGMGGEVGKERALLGKLEDQYVLRDELFSQCITLKGNLLLISKCFDDVLVLQTLQHLELVPQMRLLLPPRRTHHLQHHTAPRTPVREQLTPTPPRQQRHTVLRHNNYTPHTLPYHMPHT